MNIDEFKKWFDYFKGHPELEEFLKNICNPPGLYSEKSTKGLPNIGNADSFDLSSMYDSTIDG